MGHRNSHKKIASISSLPACTRRTQIKATLLLRLYISIHYMATLLLLSSWFHTLCSNLQKPTAFSLQQSAAQSRVSDGGDDERGLKIKYVTSNTTNTAFCRNVRHQENFSDNCRHQFSWAHRFSDDEFKRDSMNQQIGPTPQRQRGHRVPMSRRLLL